MARISTIVNYILQHFFASYSLLSLTILNVSRFILFRYRLVLFRYRFAFSFRFVSAWK